MNGQSRAAMAFALGVGCALFGYAIPVVGVVLTVCLLLVVLAGLFGDAGPMADLIALPFTALGKWLGQKDDAQWLRRAPVIGLVAGFLIRWIANSFAIGGN